MSMWTKKEKERGSLASHLALSAVVTQVCHALRHTHRDHSTLRRLRPPQVLNELTYNMSELTWCLPRGDRPKFRVRQGVPEANASGLGSWDSLGAVKTMHSRLS